MNHRIISAILVAVFTIVFSPELIKGQSIDSLLYLIDNDLVEDEFEKYDLLSQVLEDISDTENKIRYCDQAIALAQELDIQPALPYRIKGEAYLDYGKLALALECFIQAVSYYEENGDSGGLGKAYNLIAETYNYTQGFRESEKHYLQNAIEIFEQENDSILLAFTKHNLGYAHYSMGQYDTALVVFTETLDLFKKLNKPYADFAYFVCLGNLGLVYTRLADFDKAEEYLLTAMDTLTSLGGEFAVTEFMTGYASILRQKGEIKQAINYASRALNISDIPLYQRDASRLLSQLYKISGRFDSAYYYQSIFIVANDSTNNLDNVLKMTDLLTEYKVRSIQAEVDALKREKLVRSIAIMGLGIILLLAIGLVTLYYTNMKRSRKLSKALEERGVLLEKQKEEIESQRDYLFVQNEEITDSINYAQRIQSAILPPEDYFHEILNDVFILFKPRDIVSGDFYWIKQVNQYVILAAADCTGHGVPGAFMSMLGISYLNEIVQRREITQANEVLNELRKQVRISLRQHGQPEESKDGVDMALCVIDEKNKVLQYSGANRPLYLIRDQNGTPELTEYKADRMSLAYNPGRFQSFTNVDVQLEFGDVFYLFSDGFVDQKGGSEGKKFLSKNFKKLLLEIHQEPMREQKYILEQTLRSWMGDTEQIDDISVIGMRV